METHVSHRFCLETTLLSVIICNFSWQTLLFVRMWRLTKCLEYVSWKQQNNTTSSRNWDEKNDFSFPSTHNSQLIVCEQNHDNFIGHPYHEINMFIPLSRKLCFNKLERIWSTSKQVYYFEERRFFARKWSVGLSVIKGFWIFRHHDRCKNGKRWEWRSEWMVKVQRMEIVNDDNKKPYWRGFEDWECKCMKRKKRVKVWRKMFLMWVVKNMFSAFCHLSSTNVTGVWEFLVKSGRYLFCPGKMRVG